MYDDGELFHIKTPEKIDLYTFYQMTVANNYQKLVDAKHIKLLSNELELLFFDNSHRLCVSMPPRHSKSSLITLAYPIYLLIQNKNLNIMIVNSSASLSESFGIRIREYVKQLPDIFNLYLSDVKHAKNYLMFCDREGNLYNGSIRLVGAGGSITGQDADYLIIDDPYSGFDDITPTLLQKKIDLV